MEKVSGILTTYGRERAIAERSLKSMLEQKQADLEVIVVDDNVPGSALSGKIRAMCGEYPGVLYLNTKGHQGAPVARNLGLSRATGEFVAFLDDDDIWLPDKTRLQLEAFAGSGADFGVVFCGGTVRNEDTGEETRYYNSDWIGEVTFRDLLKRDEIGTTTGPLIRRSCITDCGGFWEIQPARQDYEMWIRLSGSYRILGIGGNGFIYTHHEGDQITKHRTRERKGYRNIMARYLEDYKKDPEAMDCILTQIIRCGGYYNPVSYLYWLKRQILRLRRPAVSR